MANKVPSEDELLGDKYKKIILLAKERPLSFARQVEEYLSRSAAFVARNVYHLGPSTVLYRSDIPSRLEDKGLINVALNLTATTRKELEHTMLMIGVQPGFEVFKSYPAHPDPLILDALDS